MYLLWVYGHIIQPSSLANFMDTKNIMEGETTNFKETENIEI